MRNLLEVIAEEVNLVCLSDLRILYLAHFDFTKTLSKIPENLYTVKEWTNAVRYILEDYERLFVTEAEARACLLFHT